MITSVGLFMLLLLNLEEQITLQHLKRQLSLMIQKMPLRRFVVGDNAYVCSETLLTPFSGVEKDPSKDAFSLYLSQLRIRIEQTFGLMTGNGEFSVNHFR